MSIDLLLPLHHRLLPHFVRQHTHLIYCKEAYSLNLLQLVESPTHLKGNILDLVFSSQSHVILNLSNSPFPTDHMVVSFHFFSNHNTFVPSIPCFRWNFSKADVDGLFTFTCSANFDPILQSHDVNFCWSNIRIVICSACNTFVPVIKASRHHSPPWFSLEIRHWINKSRYLHCFYN